ncbi:MAG: c-type cytochrome [Gemmatimonadetes bacterium]|nr:c-type cytochrome [Gemmatimonadota bacterium]
MWATNLRIVALVLGTLGLYTLIANEIPQVQSEVPQTLALGADVTPEQLVAAGERVFTGAGGCTACHGLGTRAPNLLTDEKGTGLIGERCGKREPGKSCKQYLYESLDNPNASVVPGYEPIMPAVTRQLPPAQVWAVIAFLESQGGSVDVTASDIPAQTPGLTPGASPGSAGGGALAGGSTDPMTLFRVGGCVGCHKLGAEGGAVGPDLSRIGARQTASQIRVSILDPDARITPGFENFKGIMPKTFGDQLTAAQLEALVRFLAARR